MLTSAGQRWLALLISSERFRFLAVGAWNTLFGYFCFLFCHWWMGQKIGPFWTLILSYCLSVPHAYLTQRILVFRSKGNFISEFCRFLLANSTIFLANLLLLPLLVYLTRVDERWIQAALVAVLTVASFLAHKYFSFSRPR